MGQAGVAEDQSGVFLGERLHGQRCVGAELRSPVPGTLAPRDEQPREGEMLAAPVELRGGELVKAGEQHEPLAQVVGDEGLGHAGDIAASYASDLPLTSDEIEEYLTQNITYEPDESMLQGMQLYFELAHKHGLIRENRALEFVR